MPQFGQGPLWPESTDHGKAGIKTGWGRTKEEAQCCALEQMRDGLTDNSHLALSSQVNFSFISHSFVYFFLVILSHFIVTVHLLPPQWQPKKTGITLFKRETEAERCLISAHRQQKERKNKEGKGEVRRRGNRAGAAQRRKGWQHKGWFSFCFFSSINIWAPACIYPHSLFMNQPGKNTSREEDENAKARDSSNQPWFKWHWVTEPGVLWLAVHMRRCAHARRSALMTGRTY